MGEHVREYILAFDTANEVVAIGVGRLSSGVPSPMRLQMERESCMCKRAQTPSSLNEPISLFMRNLTQSWFSLRSSAPCLSLMYFKKGNPVNIVRELVWKKAMSNEADKELVSAYRVH